MDIAGEKTACGESSTSLKQTYLQLVVELNQMLASCVALAFLACKTSWCPASLGLSALASLPAVRR